MGSPRRTADYQQLRTEAAARHGLVGFDQLRALGVPSSTTGDWCASGRLTRLAKGVYAVPELVDDRSLLAAVCLSRPEAVASHRAAANLWGLDGIEADVVEVTVPRRVQLTSGTVHRSDDLAAFDVVEVEGIRCTDPTRTLVDLGAVIASDRLERAVESALRRRLTTVPRLQWRMSGLARSGRRGPASLRHVLEHRHADAPPTESELETRFLQCLRAAGVRQPVRQHHVQLPGGSVVRLDDAYPDAMVFVELDGWEWHRSKSAFRRDRRRQNQVVLLGWQPLRFTWLDVVVEPERVAQEVAAILRRRWAASASARSG